MKPATIFLVGLFIIGFVYEWTKEDLGNAVLPLVLLCLLLLYAVAKRFGRVG